MKRLLRPGKGCLGRDNVSQAGNRLERLGLVCLGQNKFAEARMRLSIWLLRPRLC